MGSQESGTTEHARMMVTTEMKDGQKPPSVTAGEHLHISMCPLSRPPPQLHIFSCVRITIPLTKYTAVQQAARVGSQTEGQ